MSSRQKGWIREVRASRCPDTLPGVVDPRIRPGDRRVQAQEKTHPRLLPERTQPDVWNKKCLKKRREQKKQVCVFVRILSSIKNQRQIISRQCLQEAFKLLLVKERKEKNRIVNEHLLGHSLKGNFFIVSNDLLSKLLTQHPPIKRNSLSISSPANRRAQNVYSGKIEVFASSSHSKISIKSITIRCSVEWLKFMWISKHVKFFRNITDIHSPALVSVVLPEKIWNYQCKSCSQI